MSQQALRIVLRSVATLLASLIALTWPLDTRSQEQEDPPAPIDGTLDTAPEVDTSEPYVFTTSELPYQPLQLVLSPDELPPRPTLNLGEILESVPGITAVRRSADAVEPVIRGLSWERIQTQVGPVPIYGACPARMDPPVTYLPSHVHGDTTVSIGLPSVTNGPGGPGGRIALSADYERFPTGRWDANGWVAGTYDSARNGWGASIGEYGGLDWMDAALSAEISRLGDYQSGDGTVVPANNDVVGGTLNLAFRPTDDHRFWNYLRYTHEGDVDFPALPMDNRSTNFWLYSGGYRIAGAGALESAELTGGFNRIDHLMNNENKPNRGRMEAETPGETLSVGAALQFELRPAESVRLDSGLDFTYLNRDATRERFMVASGQTFYDHIWPDATQWTLGAFGEVGVPISERLSIIAGGRLDIVDSKTGDPDGPSLEGLTIREQYVAAYGENAGDVDQIEVVGAFNGQLRWAPNELWVAYTGGGGTMRAAGVTERYFAFAPAPGGFLIGNPALSPETKWEIVAGLEITADWLDVSLTAFTFFVTDYILPTVIDERDIDGDTTPDTIYGYLNVDAFLAGGEIVATLHPLPYLSFPLALAYTYGQNQTDDVPLPEVPPLMGHVDARLDFGTTYAWWVSVGTEFAADYTRVDPRLPQIESDGYALLRASAGLYFWNQLEIEVLADNLLDTEYAPALSREVLLPAGDLTPGQKLPAPGRSVTVTARWMF